MTDFNGGPARRRYGCWAGKPNGNAEDLTRCAESVRGSGGGFSSFISVQCSRARGHGLNGEYCKQHAKRYPAVPSDQRSSDV